MKDAPVKEITKNTRAIHTDVGCYVVSMDSSYPAWEDTLQLDSKVDWEAHPTHVHGFSIVPYGVNNNLPVEVRNMLDDNNLAPGILERELGLLYGQGPQLYRTEFDEQGNITKVFVQDKEVWDWLQSWNFRRYVDMAMTEYKHLKGLFVRWYRNKGVRIGKPGFITELKIIPGTDSRLVWPEGGSKRLEDVRQIVTGDFENNCLNTGVIPYPVFNKRDPFRWGVSMSYHNSYSFARNFYSVPSFWGSRRWIMRSSDVPDTLKYLADNAITSAYHIQSPDGYWKEKEKQISEDHPDWSDKQISNKLQEVKDTLFKRLSSVLTGKKNAGKFIETVTFYDDMGSLCEWKITALDQKVKDFIDAMIKISDKADSATTSGMGLHPSLSNIIVNGQLSSGSQMLYALKLYLASDTAIPEEIIFEALNQAIAINFPNKELRMGFYHQVVAKEQEVSPDKRTKDNV